MQTVVSCTKEQNSIQVNEIDRIKFLHDILTALRVWRAQQIIRH